MANAVKEVRSEAKVIEVSDLTKHFGAVTGIENVSFSVSKGEIFGFLGPNGAGKTTTIRLLLHLLRPDSGTIRLFGIPVAGGTAEIRERIGYLPGEFRPWAGMRAGYFLDFTARFRKRSPKLRSFLFDRLKFSPREQRQYIKHLSHGNRQKLGLVFALEHEPELAILDEPTLGLDPLMQEAFFDILQVLRDRGTTIFLSSHVLAEVEKSCGRIAIVRNGRLVAHESIESLKNRYPRRLIIELPDGTTTAAPQIPGVRLLSRDGHRCTYIIEGNLQEVLQSVVKIPVSDLFLPEPDLEELFMAYYQEGTGV